MNHITSKNKPTTNNIATTTEATTQANDTQEPFVSNPTDTTSNDNKTTAKPVAAQENQANETTLTPEESKLLAKYEQTIKDGLKTFVDVGNALAEINDNRLYRGTHKTFGKYCQDKFGFQRAHAYRIIKAKHKIDELYPEGDKPESLKETHLRLLNDLSREEALQCIAEAQKNGKEEVITLANIQKAVNAIRPAKERQTRSKEAKSEGSNTSKDTTIDNKFMTSVLETVRMALKQANESKNLEDALTALKNIEVMLTAQISGSSSVTASIDVVPGKQELPKAA